jgi:hypothetical protein
MVQNVVAYVFTTWRNNVPNRSTKAYAPSKGIYRSDGTADHASQYVGSVTR